MRVTKVSPLRVSSLLKRGTFKGHERALREKPENAGSTPLYVGNKMG